LSPDPNGAAPRGPRDLDHAVDALRALDTPDSPFHVVRTQTDKGTVVSVHWKVWDARWKTVMGSGSQDLDYQIDVTLDDSAGTYRFIEGYTRVESSTGLLPLDLAHQKSTQKFRGKTAFTVHKDFVRSGEVTVEDGAGNTTTGRTWVGTFRPRDLKDPVFEALRGLGWRPKHDNRWNRFWEK
jgi:hypothetical protein